MRHFTQVDVFTEDFRYGNPVAVVHDADGLADDDLAAFARWTNLSETTFLLRDARTVLDLEPDWDAIPSVGVIGPYPAGSEADFEVRAFTSLAGREDPV